MHSALRRIGLALNASHNLVVTDNPSAKTNEECWETDHSTEVKDLEYIEKILINTGIYHGCKCCNAEGPDEKSKKRVKMKVSKIEFLFFFSFTICLIGFYIVNIETKIVDANIISSSMYFYLGYVWSIFIKMFIEPFYKKSSSNSCNKTIGEKHE